MAAVVQTGEHPAVRALVGGLSSGALEVCHGSPECEHDVYSSLHLFRK